MTATTKHQHPRKHPDAVWRKRLGYETRKRRAQALRTPFRRLGDKRATHLWRRQVFRGWRAKAGRP